MAGASADVQVKQHVCHILGVPFSTLSFAETVSLIKSWMEGTTPRQVITANPEIVMYAREDAHMWEVTQKADIITPDGIGAVLAARLLGQPVEGRVTGADMLPPLLDKANQENWPVYLFGAGPDSFTKALANLRTLYPKIRFEGRNGYFSEQDIPQIMADIRRHAPRLLLVGLGMGKQEKFIFDHLDELNVPVSIGIGGVIDIYAGTVKRAPVFWQKVQLEWFYRLMKQPSRWRRQLVLPRFAWTVVKGQIFGKRQEK